MTLTDETPRTDAAPMTSANPIARFFGVRVRLWPMLILIAALVSAVLFGAMNAPTVNWLVALTSQAKDDQVITAVERVDEHVLVQLRAEGIKEKQQDGSFLLGVEIPGTNRTTFLRYGFDAKLGVQGDAVSVTPQGEHVYLVSVPPFVFIGYDDFASEVAVENNGILSWTTPDIDELELSNSILTAEAEQQYVDENVDVLREQADAVLTRIIRSVDPDATIEFEFAQ